MQTIFEFLKELKLNNNREWFNANKERWLDVKQRAEEIAFRLIAEVAKFDPDAARLTPSDCMYRIYRDTRFSADKTPYKTHIGIYINPNGGKKSPRCGYYVHLEPGASCVAGGAWNPSGPMLKAIRQDIFDNIDEYLEIIHDPKFTAYFPVVGEEPLKTVPKGFPKDWEHIDLLKPRWFTVTTPISDRTMLSSKVISAISDRMRLLKPFDDFLNYTVDQFL